MSSRRDTEGLRIGMWLFLYSEIILFGGLFVLYAVYYHNYPEFFVEGGRELNRIIGALNTVVLLVSSFTVAASITAIQRGKASQAVGFLLFSLACGMVFLVNKYFEWGAKFHHGLYPGSELMQLLDRGHHLYFSLYFFQ